MPEEIADEVAHAFVAGRAAPAVAERLDAERAYVAKFQREVERRGGQLLDRFDAMEAEIQKFEHSALDAITKAAVPDQQKALMAAEVAKAATSARADAARWAQGELQQLRRWGYDQPQFPKAIVQEVPWGRP